MLKNKYAEKRFANVYRLRCSSTTAHGTALYVLLLLLLLLLLLHYTATTTTTTTTTATTFNVVERTAKQNTSHVEHTFVHSKPFLLYLALTLALALPYYHNVVIG